jgi:hypothetical protein
VQRRTLAAILIGASVGSVIAIGALALVASRVIETGVDLDVVDAATQRGRATFAVGEGAMDLFITVVGALGGALLGAIAYAIGKEASPESPRVSLTPLVVVGAVIGAVVGFAVARAALGIAATREAEVVTVSVFRAAIAALVAGSVTGGIIGGTIERVSRPETLALGGEAWPSSPVAFMKDAARAMGLPALAILLGAGVIAVFARILLEASHGVALILFGGAAAVVLGGAAFVASHPPRPGGNGDEF